jgi:hypothetical protein
MNSVKITYIAFHHVTQLIIIALILASPIYITPGWYWWSAIFGILYGLRANIFNERLNTWKDIGNF